MTILDQIIDQKRLEVARRKAEIPARVLENQPGFDRSPLSATRAILEGRSNIIAEFKRKSPSKGSINQSLSVTAVTQGYVQAGAACLSVLTDEPFFGGTPADLREARRANPDTPILRKDFVIDVYQLLEAKAWGADLVLLIAACLTPAEVADLSQRAGELGLQVLLEVHDADELEQTLCDTVDLVGVNNRNLKTFVTSIATSLQLADQIDRRFVKISESGLHDARTMYQLAEAGYDGFLIGEAFMKTLNPGTALANTLADYKAISSSQISSNLL